MPELPEVETIRRGLEADMLGAEIAAIECRFPGVFVCDDVAYRLPLRVQALRRRGKYLLVDVSDANGRPFLFAVHLRMTGKLLLRHAPAEPAPHTHVCLTLADGRRLDFVDVRRFGRIWLFPGHAETVHPTIAALGPEPLSDDFTAASLWRSIRRHPAQAIKATLLDQTEIAGLGNIYADEALFLAGIRPQRHGRSLRKAEAARLHTAIRDVLRLGIGHRGTSFRDYVNSLGQPGSFQQLLHVYGRSGEACLVCGCPLETIRVAGRTTRFCPACQR